MRFSKGVSTYMPATYKNQQLKCIKTPLKGRLSSAAVGCIRTKQIKLKKPQFQSNPGDKYISKEAKFSVNAGQAEKHLIFDGTVKSHRHCQVNYLISYLSPRRKSQVGRFSSICFI